MTTPQATNLAVRRASATKSDSILSTHAGRCTAAKKAEYIDNGTAPRCRYSFTSCLPSRTAANDVEEELVADGVTHARLVKLSGDLNFVRQLQQRA